MGAPAPHSSTGPNGGSDRDLADQGGAGWSSRDNPAGASSEVPVLSKGGRLGRTASGDLIGSTRIPLGRSPPTEEGSGPHPAASRPDSGILGSSLQPLPSLQATSIPTTHIPSEVGGNGELKDSGGRTLQRGSSYGNNFVKRRKALTPTSEQVRSWE